METPIVDLICDTLFYILFEYKYFNLNYFLIFIIMKISDYFDILPEDVLEEFNEDYEIEELDEYEMEIAENLFGKDEEQEKIEWQEYLGMKGEPYIV